jgi:hypothetical protein
LTSICASIVILLIPNQALRLGVTEITITEVTVVLTFLALGILYLGFEPYIHRTQLGKAGDLTDIDRGLIVTGGVVVIFAIASLLAYFLIPPVVV